MSKAVVYGQVRGSSGTAGTQLMYNGTYWMPTMSPVPGPVGTALSNWTDGQIIRIFAPPSNPKTGADIRDHGAVADSGVTDNAPLINEAIQYAIATNKTTVLVSADPTNPTGFYGVNSPIFINAKGVRVTGEHQIGTSAFTKVFRSGYFGPTFFIGNEIPDPPQFYTRTYNGGTVHTAQFATSLPFTGEACTFINFSDDWGVFGAQPPLNGLANASFQFFADVMTSNPGGGNIGAMLCSRGGIDSVSSLTAFALEIGTNSTTVANGVYFTLHTNSTGSSKTLNTGAFGLSNNTLQHILCQLDGTNNLMTICVDGVLRAKLAVPAGMTITQSKYEDLCQGLESGCWPVFVASQTVGGPLQMSGVQITSSVLHPITSGTAIGTTIFTPTGADFTPLVNSIVTGSFAPANRPRQGWVTWTAFNSGTVWAHWHGTQGAAYQPHNEFDHLTSDGIETLAALNCHIHHVDLGDVMPITMGLFSYDSCIDHATIAANHNLGSHSWGILDGAGTQFLTIGPSVQISGGTWCVVALNQFEWLSSWANCSGDGGLLCIVPPQSASGIAVTNSLHDVAILDDQASVTTAAVKAWGVRLHISGGEYSVTSSTCVAFEVDNCECSVNTGIPGTSVSAPGVISFITSTNPIRPFQLPDSQAFGNNFSPNFFPWVNPSKPGLVRVGNQNDLRLTVNYTSDANRNLTNFESLYRHLEITSGLALTATRQLVLPFRAAGGWWRIHNNTTGGQSITIIGATGTGQTIANGAFAEVYDDGTNVVAA